MVLTALLIVGITVLVFIFLYFVPVNLWITAQFSGVKIGLLELVFMRVRRVPPSVVVNSLITATKAGLVIKDDIQKKYGYVLTLKEEIVGYCALLINDEPEYLNIEGKWLTNNDFIVFHRLAISEKRRT